MRICTKALQVATMFPPTLELIVGDGHMGDSAASGREGVGKHLSGVLDIVLTDRAMPDMSGEELAEAVKRNNPGKPVILATGLVDRASPESRAVSEHRK